MTPATDTRPPVLRGIVERLGGDVDAWITLENSRVPQYGPVIVSNNIISRTYELETGTVRSTSGLLITANLYPEIPCILENPMSRDGTLRPRSAPVPA